MQESHDQRAEQKRRVSELVNLSEIVPCAKGKCPCRTTSYPTQDGIGINYSGIAFPTPFKDLEKLQVQNENIALNVLGWNGRVTVYRISENPKEVSRINLLMTTSEDS